MKLTEDRVIHDKIYRADGIEVVMFKSPLTNDEWNQILKNQEDAEKWIILQQAGKVDDLREQMIDDRKIVERLKKRITPDLSNIDEIMSKVMSPEEIKSEKKIQVELQKILVI